MPKEEMTTRFKVDLSELKAGIQEANRQIRLANSEFKAATSGMDDWSKSADGVSAKLKQLNDVLAAEKQKLTSLEEQYALVVKEQGESSKGAEELRIKINSQKAAIGDTEKKIKEYSEKLADMKSSSDKAETASEKLKETIKKQQSELDAAKDKYKNLALEQGAESDAAKAAAEDISRLSSELKENKVKLEGTEEAADKLDHSIEEVGKEADKTSKGGLSAFKVALGNLISGAISQGISKLKELAAASISVGASFDSSLSKVQAISGATGEEMESLRQKAKQMGATTKFSATEASEAFEYMGMAGWKSEQMISGIDGILNLAAASGADLATTSDIVTDALTAMGYKAEDAGHLADVMAAASSNANTNVEMLGESFKYVAPVAGAMGASMEDVNLALGIMANSGIKGSAAGNSLKNALVNLQKPTAQQAEAMKRLGLGANAFKDAAGNVKPLREIMDTLRKTMGKVNAEFVDADGNVKEYDDIINGLSQSEEGLTQAEQLKNAAIIFGKQNLAGMLSIINATDEDYQKLASSIDNCGGVAQSMASTMIDNLGGDMTLMKSNLESLQIAFYEKLEPALRSGVEYLGKIIDGAKFVIDNSESFGEALRTIGDILLPIITAVGAFIISINWGSIVAAVTGGLTTIGGAFSALWATLLANPVGLIIALLAGVVAGLIVLYKRSEWFRKKVKAIGDFFIALCNTITDYGKKVFDFYMDLLEKIANGFSAVVSYWSDLFTRGFLAVKKAWDDAPAFFGMIWDSIKDVFSGVVTFWSDLFTRGFMAIKDAWDGVTDFFSDTWESIKDVFFGAADFWSDLFSQSFTAIKSAWSGVTDFFSDTWEGIKDVHTDTVDFWSDLFTRGFMAIKDAWGGVTDFFSTVWESIKDVYADTADFWSDLLLLWLMVIKDVWSGVPDFFSEVWDGIKDAFSPAKAFFTEKFSAAYDAVRNIWNKAESYFISVWNDIKSAFSSAQSWFGDIFRGAWDAVKSAFSGVGSFFGGIFDTIKGKFSSIGTAVGEAIGGAFKKVINSVIKTVEDTLNFLPNHVNPLLQTITDITNQTLPLFPTVNLPRLAKGGVVDRSILANLGEDGAEAVVPLERNTQWLDEIAKRLSIAMSGSAAYAYAGAGGAPVTNVTNNFYQTNNSPRALSRLEIYRQSKNLLSMKR